MSKQRFTRVLRSKVRVGRFGLPYWAIGLAALAIAAAAGQALGPVLAGSVTGSVVTTVAQTITLANDATTDVPVVGLATGDTVVLSTDLTVTLTANDDFAATWNDEGTEFTVAMQTQVGQLTGFAIRLNNFSGRDAHFILELKGPAGIDLDAQGVGNATNFARMSANTFLGTLVAVASTGNVTDDIQVVVEPKDDIAPGYYTIHGRIVQVQH